MKFVQIIDFESERVDETRGAGPRDGTATAGHSGGSTRRLALSDPTGLRAFDGLSWEATALARFVGEGRTESPDHTLDENVSILATIDESRGQIAAS